LIKLRNYQAAWGVALAIVLTNLLVLSGLRVLFFARYYDFVTIGLSSSDVLWAFLNGIRFDGVITSYGLGLLLWGLIWPVPISWRPIWNRLLLCLIVMTSFTLWIVVIGDILYFAHVKRHLFDELMLMSNDLGMILSLAFGPHLIHTLIFLAIAAAVLWLCWRFAPKVASRPGSIPQIIFFVFMMVAMGRGSFSIKTLQVIDAYATGLRGSGDISLNGAFSSWKATRGLNEITLPERPPADDQKGVEYCGYNGAGEFLLENDPDNRPAHPRLESSVRGGLSAEVAIESSTNASQDTEAVTRPNIVIVLMESIFNEYIDALSSGNFGVTPNIDRLVGESLVFDQFFSNGSRSIEAIQGILTGFPALRGAPDLGAGFEIMNVDSIARVAQRSGYQTFFAQSAKRRSFRMDAISQALGFQNYYGQEDYPAILDYGDAVSPFGFDHEMFSYLAQKFEASSSPFFGFLFTGSSHVPFFEPPERFIKYPHNGDTEHGFLNAINYTDWAIGDLIAKSKSQGWYDNTIFIFTGDHTFPRYKALDLLGRRRVPLIIHGASIVPKRVSRVGSHLDVLATVADLGKWHSKTYVFGHSLLNQSARNCVLLSGRYGHPSIITDDGYLVHTSVKRLESNGRCAEPISKEQCLIQMERSLFGLLQQAYTAFKTNRIAPRQGLLVPPVPVMAK
jgi:hypothetical protein